MISEKRGSNLLAMEIGRLRGELKKEVTEGLLTRCDKLALVMQFEIVWQTRSYSWEFQRTIKPHFITSIARNLQQFKS